MENTPGLAKHLDMSVAHFYVKLYLRSMRPEEKADLMKSIESVCRAYQEGIDDELIYFLLFQLKSTTCHHIYSSAARALTYATFMSESISMAYEFVVDLLLQILTGSDTSYHRKEWSPEDICREILSADSAATDADDVDTKEILSCIRNVLTSMEVRKYFINDDISMNLLEFLLINYRFHQTAKDIIFLLLKNEHLYKIFILQFIPLRIFLAERMLQNYVKILSFSIANVYTSNERVLTKLLAKKGEARKRAVLSLYLFARFKLFSDLIMAKSTISDLTEMIYEDSTYRKLALLAVSEIPRKASELATNNRFHNTSCYETNAVCCDLILRFDNENTIWVSRDILSYHSDVFRAMFFGGFSETGKAEVHLPCDSFEEFQLLYKLLLQNHVDSSHGDMDDSSMVGVLELADKYLMKEVYGIVLNHIKSNTRPFLESLIESDILRYKEELLSHTFKYVCVKIPETSKRLEMLEKIIDNFVPQDLFEDFLYDMLDESQKQGLHLADFP